MIYEDEAFKSVALELPVISLTAAEATGAIKERIHDKITKDVEDIQSECKTLLSQLTSLDVEELNTLKEFVGNLQGHVMDLEKIRSHNPRWANSVKL